MLQGQAAPKAKVGEASGGDAPAMKDLRKLSVAELRDVLRKAGVPEHDLKGGLSRPPFSGCSCAHPAQDVGFI